MAARLVYRFAEQELDPSQGCVRRPGQPEQYPRLKVLRVLLYLLEHHDRVVSKDELVKHLWNGSAVTDDVVFHCISDIRALLGDSRESARFVRTFPAEGYRFVAPVEVVSPTGDGQPAMVAGGSMHGRRQGPRLAAVLLLLAAVAVTLITLDHRTGGTVLPQAEVAWWRFDEGGGTLASDYSGRDNPGALAGQPVWVEGRLGKAIRLDGVRDQVVGVRAGKALPQGASPRTVSAWIRTLSTNGDQTCVFEYGSARLNTFRLSLTDRGLAAGGRPYDEIQGTSRVDDGAWHLAAVTYDGPETNMLRLFVDGVQEAAQKMRSPPDTGAAVAWRIGHYLDSSTPYRGAIDDVRVFPQALPAPALMALYRCSSNQIDLALADGRRFYYLPVFPSAAIQTGREGEIRNAGSDLGGAQLAASDGTCAIESLRGAALGQNLQIGMELLVPPQPGDAVASGGPFFRSRAAAPGDGIIGGTSAGYWVQLYSTGATKVRRLNPSRVVAFAPAPAGFDATRFHRLEVIVNGNQLRVTLDGVGLEFDQGGNKLRVVEIPPAWEGLPPVGVNQGAAGVAFASEPRGRATGQRFRNIRIAVLPPS